jgi:uncharacterized protein (DUF885 family)
MTPSTRKRRNVQIRRETRRHPDKAHASYPRPAPFTNPSTGRPAFLPACNITVSLIPAHPMKRFATICAVLVLLLAGVGVALFVNVWYFKPVTIDAFYARAFAQLALDHPEMLTELRILPSWLDFYGDKLDDASPEQDRREAVLVKANLDMLHRYDRNALDREGRVSYDTLDYFLRIQAEGDPYRLHTFPVQQLDGVHMTLPHFMMQSHQVTSAREASDYIARLGAFPKKFDQLLENLELRRSRGITPPHFVVEKVIAQLNEFVARPSVENALFTSFKAKLEKIPPEQLDVATRERLLAQAAAAISTSVYPAYRKLTDHFVGLRPLAQRDDGAWSMPDGDAYYAWCVRKATTTGLTPAQIHELGVAEVTRVAAELETLLRSQGLTDGSIGARLAVLSRDPTQLFPNTAEGRAAILERYQAILDDANRGLGSAFDVRPKLGVEVRAVPSSRRMARPLRSTGGARWTARGRASSMPTSATRRQHRSSRCARLRFMKGSQAIISRSRSRTSSPAFRSFARSFSFPPTAKAGDCMPSGSLSSSASSATRWTA